MEKDKVRQENNKALPEIHSQTYKPYNLAYLWEVAEIMASDAYATKQKGSNSNHTIPHVHKLEQNGGSR